MARSAKTRHDCFGSLSDTTLAKILCMTKSYRFAVQCSAISKRWRTLYILLPSLHFTFEDIFNGKHPQHPKIKYEEVISTALFRHRGKIKAVRLEALDFNTLRSWLRFLSFVRVEEIELVATKWNINGSSMFDFLPELFSCSSLTKLSFKCRTPYLFSCFSSPPFTFGPASISGFPLLTSCLFDGISVDNEAFLVKLLSYLPQIQSLQLVGCHFESQVRISSSSLSSLIIYAWSVDSKHKIIIDCPKLSKLCVWYDLLKNMQQVPDIQVMEITKIPNPSPSLWKKMTEMINIQLLSLDFAEKESCSSLEEKPFDDEKGLDYVKRLEKKVRKLENQVQVLQSQVKKLEEEEVKEHYILLAGHGFCEVKELQKLTMNLKAFGTKEKWLSRQVIEKCPKLKVLTVILKTNTENEDYLEQRTVEDAMNFFGRIAKFKRDSTTICLKASILPMDIWW